MTTKTGATIEVWVGTVQPEGKAALPTVRRGTSLEVTQIKVSDFADKLAELLAQVDAVFGKAEKVPSSLVVDEIELNIGINAKGGLFLIGKLEAGMEAGIKVKLKRPDA